MSGFIRLEVTGAQIRIRDLAVALAELERWSLDDPILAGRLDLTKVAVMGFSFGGVTAGEMARTNPRCKVAVTLEQTSKRPGRSLARHPTRWILQNHQLEIEIKINQAASLWRSRSLCLWNPPDASSQKSKNMVAAR